MLAKRGHVRQAERALAQSGPVGSADSAELGDMAKRVGTEIAEGFGVRRSAYAKGIENE